MDTAFVQIIILRGSEDFNDSLAFSSRMGIIQKQLKDAFNKFEEEGRLFRVEMLEKEANKYLGQLELRKAHADEKELKIIETMSTKFKTVVEDFQNLKKDYELIKQKIADFPFPYYLMLSIKDRVSIFPKDLSNNEQMDVIEAPEDFLPMNKFVLLEGAQQIREIYEKEPQGIEFVKLHNEELKKKADEVARIKKLLAEGTKEQ